MPCNLEKLIEICCRVLRDDVAWRIRVNVHDIDIVVRSIPICLTMSLVSAIGIIIVHLINLSDLPDGFRTLSFSFSSFFCRCCRCMI
jgi:hypothetical protein